MSDLLQTIGHRPADAAQCEWRSRRLFEAVACSSDLPNDPMILGVRRGLKCCLAARAAPAPGQFCVGLAGGTGDVAYRYLSLGIACIPVGTQPQAAAR
jgi:ubiquinone/menaquinone biosynthesis C-methylase UbiE